MKKSIFIIGIALLWTSGLFAQELKWENASEDKKEQKMKKGSESDKPDFSVMPYSVNIREGRLSMSQGSNYGYNMILPEISEKEVKSLWKELMKDYGSKPKKVKKSDDLLAAEIRISGISGSGSLDIYSQTKKSGDGVELSVWFGMGEGKYLNSNDYPKSYKEGEDFLQKFAKTVKRASIENELKDEEKELKKLEKDLRNLVKKKEGLEKDIENYKRKIIEAEQDIVKNEAAQEETENIIKEQQTTVEEVAHRLKTIH